MNSSSYNYTVSSSVNVKDTMSLTAAKNVIVIALGLVINYINGTLIHTFRKHPIFYMNPRYNLFIHLVVNDIIQLTTSISLFVISYIVHKINASLCCLIITLAVFTTLNTPLILTLMAVECYIAVCFPLQHAELCSIKRTYILVGCVWVLSSLSFLPDIFITLATEPLRLFFATITCERDNLFHHPVSIKKRDVSHIIFLAGVWLTLIFTYLKIFFAANLVSKNTKKARNTILLHGFQLLLCMLTYVSPLLNAALMRLFPKYYAHTVFVWYIIVQILPRFISPIVYGLRDKMFKHYFKKYLLCGLRAANRPLLSVKLVILF